MSYVRVSILGTQLTEEVWSVNLVFDPTGEFPGGVNQTALDTAAAAIALRTIPVNMRNLMSTSAAETGARLEVRDDVTDALIALSLAARATPQVGTNPVTLTPQSAIVCSILTNTPGASGRGRIYWPAMGATLGSTGRLAQPLPVNIIADFKSYFAGIRSDLAAAFPTIGFDLAVRSKTTKSTPHAVTIRVGNVIDTQRRRRDSIAEAYVSTSVP